MNSRRFAKLPGRFLISGWIIFVFVVLLFSPVTQARAQTTQWPPPQTIPGYDPETWPPILIADQNQTVHAFSTQSFLNAAGELRRIIFYNKWTLEQGWTLPIDIIISPIKEARITGAYLDRNGIFHVVFFGGDNTAADIYYSKAPATLAGDARAWSMPFIIGDNAGDPEDSAIVEDDRGVLHVVYFGRRKEEGYGLYVVNSNDGGETWSSPVPIFYPLRDEPFVSELRVIKSKSGWLHAIWAVNNDDGQGRGIYYTRSQDGNGWDQPIVLADAQDGLGTQTPTIIENNGTLFAIFVVQTGEGNKTVMRQSRDEGNTWDNISIIFPRHQGVNGLISPVVDGNSELHLFFGQRIQEDITIHGMWHSIYINNHWTEPEALVKGFKILRKEGEGDDSFDPNSAQAVVSQGNVILVTWRTDPGSQGNGVWYSYKKIDAPQLPVVPLPTPSIPVDSLISSPASTPISDFPIVTPSPTDEPLNEVKLENTSSLGNVGNIIAGAAILIFLLIAVRFFVKNR